MEKGQWPLSLRINITMNSRKMFESLSVLPQQNKSNNAIKQSTGCPSVMDFAIFIQQFTTLQMENMKEYIF